MTSKPSCFGRAVFLHSSSCFLIMAAFAKRLPVAFIPKQLHVAPVRDDMVNHGSGREFALLHTCRTQRMAAEKTCAGGAPLAAISPAGGVFPRKQDAMRFAVHPVRQVRAARIPTGPFGFSWHFGTSQYDKPAMVIDRIAAV